MTTVLAVITRLPTSPGSSRDGGPGPSPGAVNLGRVSAALPARHTGSEELPEKPERAVITNGGPGHGAGADPRAPLGGSG